MTLAEDMRREVRILGRELIREENDKGVRYVFSGEGVIAKIVLSERGDTMSVTTTVKGPYEATHNLPVRIAFSGALAFLGLEEKIRVLEQAQEQVIKAFMGQLDAMRESLKEVLDPPKPAIPPAIPVQ